MDRAPPNDLLERYDQRNHEDGHERAWTLKRGIQPCDIGPEPGESGRDRLEQHKGSRRHSEADHHPEYQRSYVWPPAQNTRSFEPDHGQAQEDGGGTHGRPDSEVPGSPGTHEPNEPIGDCPPVGEGRASLLISRGTPSFSTRIRNPHQGSLDPRPNSPERGAGTLVLEGPARRLIEALKLCVLNERPKPVVPCNEVRLEADDDLTCHGPFGPRDEPHPVRGQLGGEEGDLNHEGLRYAQSGRSAPQDFSS